MSFTPRSGAEELGGIAWLPRMIDKARAKENDELGEFIFPCPIDRQLLQRLDMDADTFQSIAVNHSDEEVVKKVQEP